LSGIDGRVRTQSEQPVLGRGEGVWAAWVCGTSRPWTRTLRRAPLGVDVCVSKLSCRPTQPLGILNGMEYCPDCNWNLDQVAVGSDCPGCGGVHRAAVAKPEAVEVVAVVNSVGWKHTRGNEPSWQQKWRAVVVCRDDLREAYENRLADKAESRALSFFVTCHHLPEWLKGDIDNLAGITKDAVDAHVKAEVSLQACEAIANTDKHHTRNENKKVTARIRSTEAHPDQGIRVTIEVKWAEPDAHNHDALELANECVASWEAFLAKHRIENPYASDP
jgi:hypothetical protein